MPRTRYDKVAQCYGWEKIKKEAQFDKKIKFLKIRQVGRRINFDKNEPTDIDLDKIDSWIKGTRNKKNMPGHLQWLKDNYVNQRHNWVEIL